MRTKKFKREKKEVYSFDPTPKPKRFIFIDKEYEAIYKKIKYVPRKVDELVDLKFDRNTIVYYKHIGLFEFDTHGRVRPTLAGHAYLTQRRIEKRRALAAGVISVILSVIAAILTEIITK